MESGVFVLHGDNTLVRMTEQPYDAEAILQRMLTDHPDLLAGDQINPAVPRRWLLISPEVGIPGEEGGSDRWSLDHLFLDQDAVPTFVETKRSNDTRARREVVAQMLDYAANATEYWPVDRMREQFVRQCAKSGVEPDDALVELLGPDADAESYWSQARTNLREGRIRLLFVADRIPASLRRIVEFLNRQMRPAEVLAVEIRQFASPGETLRTLVPRVIGQTEQAQAAKSVAITPGRSSPVSRAEFLEQLPLDRRDAALAVLQVAEDEGFTISEYQVPGSTASVRITVDGIRSTPITLSTDFLWVSLGRYHEALREPAVNEDIRQALCLVAPSLASVRDPKKSEVGVPLESIGSEVRQYLAPLFRIVRHALSQD